MSEPYDLKVLSNWLIIANQQDISKSRQKMSKLGGGFGCFSTSQFQTNTKIKTDTRTKTKTRAGQFLTL